VDVESNCAVGKNQGIKKIMALDRSLQRIRLKCREASYQKLKICEEEMEERRHKIAQKLIEKTMKQADVPIRRKPGLRIKLRRVVRIKIGRSVINRFIVMRSVTRGFMARVLVIISSISSKTRSVVLSICLDRDT
jgi:hypothetical protein